MATVIRVGITRMGNLQKNLLCMKVETKGIRNISSKSVRASKNIQRPPPYPYNEKKYTMLHRLFDKTTSRFDENTKLLVVEGPPAAGKSKLARALAEELDMLYFPEANQDMVFINESGFDLRSIDEQVPESCRTFDIDNFLRTPKHFQSAAFQVKQYAVKFEQYIDALAHLLSTGQGVVLDRCVYSDFVFLEAMYGQGFISKKAKKGYYEIRDNSLMELLRPHLIIYLDVPVPKVQENIKKRAISYEKNSPALTPQYLGAIETFYKQHYLKEMSKHSELLVYDWSEEGDTEIVIEDIERTDLEPTDHHNLKFLDWLQDSEEEWAVLRNAYADQKPFEMTFLDIPLYNVPEFVIEGTDYYDYLQVLETTPGFRYRKGYDPTMGDKGLLFKTGLPNRQPLPLRERRQPNK